LLRLTLGYIQLITSLLNIFYTTARYPYQIRLRTKEDNRIGTFFIGTVGLVVSRTLVVGSRVAMFLLFAKEFHCWLFAVVGFHYLFTFAVVFCQLWFSGENLIHRVVYNIVTPFVYTFDYCIDWMAGPNVNSYWYEILQMGTDTEPIRLLIWHLPTVSENLLIMWLPIIWFGDENNKHWYAMIGIICGIVMSGIGGVLQIPCYRYWRPKFERSSEQSRSVHTAAVNCKTVKLGYSATTQSSNGMLEFTFPNRPYVRRRSGLKVHQPIQ